MKFFDEAIIRVYAGAGGSGCMSFLREKYRPKGGPDGGNGGNGGSVWIQVNPHLNTLVDFRYKTIFKARNGGYGQGKLKAGKTGADEIINVPLGTIIYDNSTQELIDDLNMFDSRALVAKGGDGGLGNACFKSSVNRAPRKSTGGSKGENRELKLELRLLADIGLVGLPNAGKSTLIRALSNAKPKVADYPFTTLHPNLGVIEFASGERLTLADVPGLVRDASKGAGLGIRFLKHLMRTKHLIHMIDISSADENVILDSVSVIYKELEAFGNSLLNKINIIALNKLDLVPDIDVAKLQQLIQMNFDFSGDIIAISAETGQGTQAIVDRLEHLTY